MRLATLPSHTNTRLLRTWQFSDLVLLKQVNIRQPILARKLSPELSCNKCFFCALPCCQMSYNWNCRCGANNGGTQDLIVFSQYSACANELVHHQYAKWTAEWQTKLSSKPKTIFIQAFDMLRQYMVLLADFSKMHKQNVCEVKTSQNTMYCVKCKLIPLNNFFGCKLLGYVN